MDNSQNNIGYFPQMPVCDKHSSVELNSDFSLPDYQPEIRRLLSSRAIILPQSEYIGNGNAEASGEINYKITYLGADGSIYCANLSDKYSFSSPLEFNLHNVNTDEVTLLPSCKTESINVRVLGPRKLNVRSKLDCHLYAFSPALFTPNLVGPHNKSALENQVFETSCINVKKSVNESKILNEFISFDSDNDNFRIIDCISDAIINECSATNDKIAVRGDVVLKIFYCNETESAHPLITTKKIPFSHELSCVGVNSLYECYAKGVCFDERFDFQNNGVAVELTLLLSAMAQRNETVKYIYDSYSTEKKTESSSADLIITNNARCSHANLTQNDIFSLENIKLSPDAKIINITCKSVLNELIKENEKLIFKGVNDYQLIYFLDGEYSSVSLNSPVKYELDSRSVPELTKAFKWRAESSVPSVRARHDGERLFVDCELNFNIALYYEHEIKLLNEVIFGEHHNKNNSQILLCYPEKNATIWNVAKHYGESQRAIRQKNSIPENENGIKRRFLVI